MHAQPHAMEPLFPSTRSEELEERAFAVARASAALVPGTRRAVVEVLRKINSYCSNLIEGHKTHPLDVERALREDYADEPSKRALQRESIAHIEVQREVEAELRREPSHAVSPGAAKVTSERSKPLTSRDAATSTGAAT